MAKNLCHLVFYANLEACNSNFNIQIIELSKLPVQYQKPIEVFVFEVLPNSQTIEQIGNVDKITT